MADQKLNAGRVTFGTRGAGVPRRRGRLALALAPAGIVMVLACSDALGPFEPEISSAPDNFQLQATGVTGVTATLTYTWTNTGARATIDHSTTTSAGSARLTLLDADGVVVYDATLVPSRNEPTTSGRSGTWTIRLVLTGYTGTLNFRAQKL